MNMVDLSIRIYACKIQLDLLDVRLNGRLNIRLARLIPFISVPFRPFSPVFYCLNGQPFNLHLPLKQNSLPPFTD